MALPPCREVPPTMIPQPAANRLPPIPIPEANMQSIMNTLNAMRQYLMALGGQTPPARQPYANPLLRGPTTRPGAQDRSVPKSQPTSQGRWLELSRKTENVKIVNPKDKEQFVIVQRTNQLILKDSITGEQWIYNRGGAGDTGGVSAGGIDGGFGGGSPDL